MMKFEIFLTKKIFFELKLIILIRAKKNEFVIITYYYIKLNLTTKVQFKIA